MPLALLGVLALLLVVAQAGVDVAGIDRVSGRPNIAPIIVWILFWLVVPFSSAVVGNWYADMNPWRSLARWFGVGQVERADLLGKLGLWPAAVVFIVFACLESIGGLADEPTTLGLAALLYSVFLIVAIAILGRETSLATFDMFTSYNRLISSIAPLGRNSEGRVVWRGWLRSLTVVPEWPGLWFFVTVMIATVSYDGASHTAWFRRITGSRLDTVYGQTFLLLASVALIALTYYAACTAAAAFSTGWSPIQIAQRFAHTLVPIALAYSASHYFTLILFEGQYIIGTISDPFGLGWNLFGTDGHGVHFFVTSSKPVWVLQVCLIIAGHIAGVLLAHDRSLQDFGSKAVQSQYSMLVLMVLLTSMGLLTLSG